MAKRTGLPPSSRSETDKPDKRPRSEYKDYNADRELICWHIGTMDMKGPFSWKQLRRDDWSFLMEKMASYESMTWQKFTGKRRHPIPTKDLSPEAQKRLKEIEMNDIESVFSMGLEGKPRVIGIRDRHVFKLLWWDPEHKVCLAPKKNT